jgi:hypothetical protein
MLDKKYVDVCEKLDWRIQDDDKEWILLENWSPAGEDLFVEVEAKNLVKNVREFANSFDVDEHVAGWVESRGENGVPSSVRDLVVDAEVIEKMLEDLADALEKVDKQ